MFGNAFINTLRGIKNTPAPVQPIEKSYEQGKDIVPGVLSGLLGGDIVKTKPGYNKVHGFEEDAKFYGSVNKDNPKETDALTWKDYSVSSKDGKKTVESFSVGYDDMGRIAGVRSKRNDGKIYGYYGKDLLKSFFSRFDRDATKYTVWEEENNGDNGSTWVIFDSERDNSPFIPSMIFKGDVKTTQPRRNTPVQDDFTGNLRSTRPGVSNGLNGLR